MKILGLAGWSGAGKTTLLAALIPELVRRGVSVSTIKHAHHAFDVDQPGKDSYVHREAGATEIHLRLSSPPIKWPCYYGIDTGDRSELLAANLSIEEIREYLDVDSLAFVTLDRLKAATGAPKAGFCDACFSGEYPVKVPVELRKSVLEVESGDPTPNLLEGLSSLVVGGLPVDEKRRT